MAIIAFSPKPVSSPPTDINVNHLTLVKITCGLDDTSKLRGDKEPLTSMRSNMPRDSVERIHGLSSALCIGPEIFQWPHRLVVYTLRTEQSLSNARQARIVAPLDLHTDANSFRVKFRFHRSNAVAHMEMKCDVLDEDCVWTEGVEPALELVACGPGFTMEQKHILTQPNT